MKRILVAFGALVLTLAVLGGCPGPAQYGLKLTACSETSKSWAEYTPCCVSVARAQSRDPSFCYPDGGAQ